MTDEDRTVATLKGHNCMIKFKDGEELTLYIASIDGPDEGEIAAWFYDVEKFINGSDAVMYFPTAEFAVARDTIKYVRQI